MVKEVLGPGIKGRFQAPAGGLEYILTSVFLICKMCLSLVPIPKQL